MEEILGVGQALQLNPYVTQMEKISSALGHLSQMNKRNINADRYDENVDVEFMKAQIYECVCSDCVKQEECHLIVQHRMSQLINELLIEIEEYGLELSVEKKRDFERCCEKFEEIKGKVEKDFWDIKQNDIWMERVLQSKQTTFTMMQALARAMEETTREIDASIFRDVHIEKKINKQLKHMGLRPLKVMIFVSNQGQFEVHVSAKSKQGICISIADIAKMISKILGRRVLPEKKEALVVQQTYETIIFVEQVKYQILDHVSKIEKEGSEVSGDNFLIMNVSGGKKCAMISDGMGSGMRAYHQSRMVLECAEILLESGVPSKQAMEMMNGVLLNEMKEVEFTTLDMCLIDSYKGEVDLWKAGGASSYLVEDGKCQAFEAASLPMGVMPDLQMNHFSWDIKKDCYFIMVTDGVVEHICESERVGFIDSLMDGIKTKNPKEIGNRIIEESLKKQGGTAKDDMLVLVLGVWELQF